MGVDETGTLNALRSHRVELVDAKIAEYGGRIVKTMGDGLLLEFPSVVDATQCMIEIQSGMAERNRGVDENRRIIFRIGVNLGDILIEGEDIFGDGVNVTARLQEVAQPGGLAISSRVHDDVRDRLNVYFTDSGEQSLKNIARPVRVWRWSPSASGSKASTTDDAPLPLPDKPSLAVLPFNNMSDDPEQEYFSDGISEEIITELSRHRSLFVIARNSSFHYKGQAPNVQNVGRELGVRYIVEGSVRKAGNRVRITAQLVEARSGNHLWADRYDRNLHDIFAIQDEVTNAIVTAIEPTLGSAERSRAYRMPTERLDAWESYQRGLGSMYRFTAQENTEAQSFFRRSIELDPNFAPAHAGLAYAINLSVTLGFGADPASALVEARAAAERAVTLDGDDALAHAVVGRVHLSALGARVPVLHVDTGLKISTDDARPGTGCVNPGNKRLEIVVLPERPDDQGAQVRLLDVRRPGHDVALVAGVPRIWHGNRARGLGFRGHRSAARRDAQRRGQDKDADTHGSGIFFDAGAGPGHREHTRLFAALL
jgi:adenylate cyclase